MFTASHPSFIRIASLVCALTLIITSVPHGTHISKAADSIPYSSHKQIPGLLVNRTLVSARSTNFHGGPDNFGYTFTDSLDASGPSYLWEEISTTGSQTCWIVVGDKYTCPIPIGFTFPFYGIGYSELYFNTDGYISFGSGDGSLPHGGIPSIMSPNNSIFIFGARLIMGLNSHVYFKTQDNPRRLIIQGSGLCAGYHTDPITFQAILYPNGDILLQYKTLLGRTTSFVGVENAMGTDGLAYGRPLVDNLAIKFIYPSGILFDPRQSTGYARRGAVALYQVELENKTSIASGFDLSVGPGSQWMTALPVEHLPTIPADGKTTFDVQVTVPLTASIGSLDFVNIRAVATSSPSITNTIPITTTAISDILGYIPNSAYNYVARLDPGTNALVGYIDLNGTGCSSPKYVAIPPDGETAWVSCVDSDQVVLIDRRTDTILRVLNNIPSPTKIGFTLDGEYALAGSFNSSVLSVIDRNLYSSYSMPVISPSLSIIIHPYLNKAYLTNRSGTQVSVIDTSIMSVTHTIDIGASSYFGSISHDGHRLYVTKTSVDTIALIDPLSDQIVDNINISQGGTTADCEPDQNDDKLFVIRSFGEGSGVDVLNLDSRSVERYIMAENLNVLTNSDLSCDGSVLYAVGPGQFFTDTQKDVLIIDARNLTMIAQLPMLDQNRDLHVDAGASDIAICPQLDSRPLILPSSGFSIGQPGEDIISTFIVINKAPNPITDTLQIETAGNTWPITLSSTDTGPLQWENTFTFTMTVSIPPSAAIGNTDGITVTVRSTNEPFIFNNIHVMTAVPFKVALPLVVH